MSEYSESEWQTFFDFGSTAVLDFGQSLDEVSIAMPRVVELDATRQEVVETIYGAANQASDIAAESSQYGTCLIGSSANRTHSKRRIAPMHPVEDRYANRARSKPKRYEYLTPCLTLEIALTGLEQSLVTMKSAGAGKGVVLNVVREKAGSIIYQFA